MMRGWMTFKDGQLKNGSFELTKRNLLIGYDLVSLKGLNHLERHMVKQGYSFERVKIEVVSDDHPFDFYMPTIKHRLHPLIATFSSWTPDKDRVFRTAVLYFMDEFPAEESSVLRQYYWWDYLKPKPRNISFQQLEKQIGEIFKRHHIRIEPVRVLRNNRALV